MEYRKMEKLNISTSLLGFGCMRFPTNADGSINEEETLAMIDKAYQSGVTYFDTAYPYHGGKILRRPSVLWTKLKTLSRIYLKYISIRG